MCWACGQEGSLPCSSGVFLGRRWEETLGPALMLLLLPADLGIHQIGGRPGQPCAPQQVPPLDVRGKSTGSAGSGLWTALAEPRALVGQSALFSKVTSVEQILGWLVTRYGWRFSLMQD